MRPAAAVVLAGAAMVLAGCTGTAPVPSSPAPAPAPAPAAVSATGTQEDVLRGPAGRTYRIRVVGDRTEVTLTGDPGGKRDVVVDGRYVAPRVVPDGPLEGLSPDGQWLALESHAPAPDERSVFLIVSGSQPLERDTIDLPGRFTFAAWSPTGDVLYLTEHRPPAGSGHFVVRAYDMGTQKLRPQPVAHEPEVDEQLAGRPVARAPNPSGAVVATLYVRPGDDDDHGPFVHLLHTDDGYAFRVGLPPGAPVTTSWGLKHVASSFVVTAAGRDAFRIDPAGGGVTRSP